MRCSLRLGEGELSASRSGRFTLRECIIPYRGIYLLGLWWCAPGLVCPVTQEKRTHKTQEVIARLSRTVFPPSKWGRASWREQLTIIFCRSNTAQSEFLHKISADKIIWHYWNLASINKKKSFLECPPLTWTGYINSYLLPPVSKLCHWTKTFLLLKSSRSPKMVIIIS
jgi:hypothetical protein